MQLKLYQNVIKISITPAGFIYELCYDDSFFFYTATAPVFGAL